MRRLLPAVALAIAVLMPAVSGEEMALTFPRGGEKMSGDVAVSWSSSGSGVVRLSISPDGGRNWSSVAEGLPATGTYTLNSRSYPDGKDYMLRVESASGQAASGAFWLDNTPPDITIINPGDGDTVRTPEPTVVGRAADNLGLYNIQLSTTNNPAWRNTTGLASWSGAIAMATGRGTVYARAVDMAGNTALAALNVTVDTSASESAPHIKKFNVTLLSNKPTDIRMLYAADVEDSDGVQKVVLNYQACTETVCMGKRADTFGRTGDHYYLLLGPMTNFTHFSYWATAYDNAGNDANTNVTTTYLNKTAEGALITLIGTTEPSGPGVPPEKPPVVPTPTPAPQSVAQEPLYRKPFIMGTITLLAAAPALLMYGLFRNGAGIYRKR